MAFLAGTAVIAGNGSVAFRLRTQNLTLPSKAAVLAVVRIESPPVHAPVQAAPILSAIHRIADLPGVRGIQIDFDAGSSERGFYRALLRSLPMQISQPIAVTALASWCEATAGLTPNLWSKRFPCFSVWGVANRIRSNRALDE